MEADTKSHPCHPSTLCQLAEKINYNDMSRCSNHRIGDVPRFLAATKKKLWKPVNSPLPYAALWIKLRQKLRRLLTNGANSRAFFFFAFFPIRTYLSFILLTYTNSISVRPAKLYTHWHTRIKTTDLPTPHSWLLFWWLTGCIHQDFIYLLSSPPFAAPNVGELELWGWLTGEGASTGHGRGDRFRLLDFGAFGRR